jgi:anion-transporting  ArsA/GET3 family ATPase
VLGGVLRGLERFTGMTLVREIGEFIGAIETLTGALRARVAETQALLRSSATSLVLVTAPEPRLTSETAALARALGRVSLRIDGVIVNRALPHAVFGADVPEPPLPVALDPPLAHRLRRSFEDLQTLAARQRATLAPLLETAAAPIVAEVPLLAAAPASLEELVAFGRHLVPAEAVATEEPTRGRGRA